MGLALGGAVHEAAWFDMWQDPGSTDCHCKWITGMSLLLGLMSSILGRWQLMDCCQTSVDSSVWVDNWMAVCSRKQCLIWSMSDADHSFQNTESWAAEGLERGWNSIWHSDRSDVPTLQWYNRCVCWVSYFARWQQLDNFQVGIAPHVLTVSSMLHHNLVAVHAVQRCLCPQANTSTMCAAVAVHTPL